MLRTDKTALALALAVLLVPLMVCLPMMFIFRVGNVGSWQFYAVGFTLSIIIGAYLMRSVINRVEERVSDKQKRKRP